MASNAELIEQLTALNPEFVKGDLTNAQMAAMLKAPEPEPEPAPKAKGYKVAKGKSLTTKAGIKAAGQEVTANMVGGGEDKLKLLKEKGLLV